MSESTLQPGDRVRLRGLPGTHSHLTGKYGEVVELPSESTVAVVLDGRHDALLVHVQQAVLVSRPEPEERLPSIETVVAHQRERGVEALVALDGYDGETGYFHVDAVAGGLQLTKPVRASGPSGEESSDAPESA